MDKILDIAKRNNLKVIEDAAQAIGATYKNKKAGSMGDLGCISFFPSKNLGAFGDGGMIVAKDKTLADKIKLLRLHGSDKRYVHSIIGTNARLDNLQAAILRVKLKYLDSWSDKRRENAKVYEDLFKGTDVVTPHVPEYNTHVYHQYIIKVPAEKRDGLLNKLSELGIASRVYYPIPLHLQVCYKALGYKIGDMPRSEEAAKTTLALPVHPDLGEKDLSCIAQSIKDHLS